MRIIIIRDTDFLKLFLCEGNAGMKYLLLFLLSFSSLFSSEFKDSCDCVAERIIAEYNKFKPKYEAKAWEKLHVILNRNDSLRKEYIEGKNPKINELKLVICPIVKLDSKATNYQRGENICKYIVFDTIDYESISFFYINNEFQLFMARNNNICDYCVHYGPIYTGSGVDIYDKSPIFIKYLNNELYIDYDTYIMNYQYFYNMGVKDIIEKKIFFVNGLIPFEIQETQLMLFRIWGLNRKYRVYINNPNMLIDSLFTTEWIRYCAKKCPVGGVPFWEFWKWDIFTNKPPIFIKEKYFKILNTIYCLP